MPRCDPIHTRVFVVAPAPVRWGLSRVLDDEDGCAIVGEADALDGAMAQLRCTGFDVLVVETEASQQRKALQSRPALMRDHRVLAIGAGDQGCLDWAVLAGLRGVVHKFSDRPMLLRAIRKVHEGEIWFDRATLTRTLARVARTAPLPLSDDDLSRIASLTARELQTVHALAANVSLPCKVIADRLCISQNTLRNHLTSIYAKLELRSRADLYAFTARVGLVSESAGVALGRVPGAATPTHATLALVPMHPTSSALANRTSPSFEA